MLNFQIALTNVPFDRQYKNVLRFEDREAQETFFDVSSLFLDAADVNFNIGSLLETTLIYTIKDNESINDLMSKNYCIIKDKNTNATLKYYYYFIKNAIHDSGNRQIKLWVELDIFQTYYIDLEFTDCEIMRANLNRFVEVVGDTTKVQFDGSPTSELFEREEIQDVGKRLTKRTKLTINNSTNDTLNEWLNENVSCWEYAFLKSKDFSVYKYDNNNFIASTMYKSDSVAIKDKDDKLHDTKILCICVPVMKRNRAIEIFYSLNPDNPFSYQTGQFGTKNFPINSTGVYNKQNGIDVFCAENSGDAYVLSKKYSNVPPFIFDNLEINAINEKTETIYGFECKTMQIALKYNAQILDKVAEIFTGKNNEKETFFNLKEQSATYSTKEYNVNNNLTFTKNEIINANKNVKFNPKLLARDYKEINILNQSQQSFTYDLQKINKEKFALEISEPLCADITKEYIRIKDNSGIYIKETEENFTGCVSANDTSMVLLTDEFQNMLANQKNYFQQNSLSRGVGLAKSLVGGGIGLASGGISATMGLPLGAVGGIGHGSSQLGFGVVDYISARMKEKMAVDNMKNAPADVQNAQGNVFLGIMSTRMGIYVEEYDILDNEKEIINDQMCKYGFTYNKLGNIKNFDNIRKYYNYIQANVEETHGINISNAVHDLFVNCFANGVRFWNADEFDANNPFSYVKENYEKWLEN